MFDQGAYRHLKGEADYFADLESRIPKPGKASLLDTDVTVHSQPREIYRAPFFLSKTATREQVTELNKLLEELWSVNQRFVGERAWEVWAYYAVTGEQLELEHALLTWCDGYMTRRADPSRVTARVENSPFLLAEQLVDEWYSIFGKVYLGENTVNPIFLYAPTLYTRWLLYDRLWKHLVFVVDENHIGIRETRHNDRFARMGQNLQMGGWLTNYLTPFLRAVNAWARRARLAEVNAFSNEVLRARIRGFASDIHEMRPFLVRNFHAQKTVTVLTPEVAIAWEWFIGAGIASLLSGRTAADVLKSVETRITLWRIRIGYDGLLFDARMPWYTPADLPPIDGVKPLALNYLILEHFHDKLYSFYEKIDFGRMHQPGASEAAAPTATPECDDEEAVAVACHTLAESTEEPEDAEDADATVVRRIPVLRLQRVLRLFERRLGCEIGPGKGSEVNIYRPGAKIYTLGAHKRNREVHPLTVRRMLKVLDIPVAEFHAAAFA